MMSGGKASELEAVSERNHIPEVQVHFYPLAFLASAVTADLTSMRKVIHLQLSSTFITASTGHRE